MPTTQRDAARRRDQKNQSQRRRRAELTPSNKDLDKTQNNQSSRRKRAERSPEDAQRRKAMDTLWRRRLNARQSIREYELIWLLQQRLRAVSWPHWRLRCMQPLHGHGMGVVRP